MSNTEENKVKIQKQIVQIIRENEKSDKENKLNELDYLFLQKENERLKTAIQNIYFNIKRKGCEFMTKVGSKERDLFIDCFKTYLQ